GAGTPTSGAEKGKPFLLFLTTHCTALRAARPICCRLISPSTNWLGSSLARLRSWRHVSSEGSRSAKFQACWAYRKPQSCATGGRRKRGLGKRFAERR